MEWSAFNTKPAAMLPRLKKGQSNVHKLAQMYISWLSVQYNDKKNTFWVFIQLRWARCDLYYVLTVTDRFKKTKKTVVGENGSHSSGSGTGRDFPPIFSWDWDGTRFFFFVGVGREKFENPLPCHPLLQCTYRKIINLSVIDHKNSR